jgi:hypothetical protein
MSSIRHSPRSLFRANCFGTALKIFLLNRDLLPVTSFDLAAMRQAIASIRDVKIEGSSKTSHCMAHIYRFRSSGRLPGAGADGELRTWLCNDSGPPARLEATQARSGEHVIGRFRLVATRRCARAARLSQLLSARRVLSLMPQAFPGYNGLDTATGSAGELRCTRTHQSARHAPRGLVHLRLVMEAEAQTYERLLALAKIVSPRIEELHAFPLASARPIGNVDAIVSSRP